MPRVTTQHLVRYAIHDTTSQVLTEPSASKVCLIPASPTLMRPSPRHLNISRNDRVLPNGEHVPSLRGLLNPAFGDLSFEVSGLGGGGAGDGDDASGASFANDLDGILEVIAGAKDEGTGGASSGSPGSGTTYNVDTGDGAGLLAGRGVLIRDDADVYHAAEVISRSTDALTIDQAIADELGASATFAASEECFAAKTYIWDNDLNARKHMAWFSEHEDEREYLGCQPAGASLTLEPGAPMLLNLSGFEATKVNESLTSGAGTYSEPTTGDIIVNTPQIVDIGGNRMLGSSFAFDFGIRRSMKPGGGGPLNRIGFVMRPAMPTLRLRVLMGSFTSPKELTEALANTFAGTANNARGTAAVRLQVGNQPGSCILIRMPAARLVSNTPVEEDGLRAADLVFEATESANHANVPGACRLHLF